MFNLDTKIKCPYCGHNDGFTADKTSGHILLKCNKCRKWYILIYEGVLTTDIRKIEGEY